MGFCFEMIYVRIIFITIRREFGMGFMALGLFLL